MGKLSATAHRVVSEYLQAGGSLEDLTISDPPETVVYVKQRMVVEASDDGGRTWLTFPGTEDGIDTDASLRATWIDHDPSIRAPRLFRSYVLGELCETSPTIVDTRGPYTVVALEYKVLDEPSPLRLPDDLQQQFSLDGFSVVISGRTLTATPNRSYTSMRRARSDFMDAAYRWIYTNDVVHQCTFGIQFRMARCRPEGSSFDGAYWQIVNSAPSEPVGLDVRPILRQVPTEVYPVGGGPIARRLLERLHHARMNNESPLTLGYAVKTLVEAHFGGEKIAADRLNVSRNVLSQIARLSTRDDPRAWRKIDSASPEALTAHERGWLAEAIGMIAIRAAMAEGGETYGARLTKDAVERARQERLSLHRQAPEGLGEPGDEGGESLEPDLRPNA